MDTSYAKEYAEYYGIDPQGSKESDSTFMDRVANVLRKMGKVIEAHEAKTGKRIDYDDPTNLV